MPRPLVNFIADFIALEKSSLLPFGFPLWFPLLIFPSMTQHFFLLLDRFLDARLPFDFPRPPFDLI